jgi:hypothetical protein
MKRMSKEDFADRVMALERARRIFIESGLTNNISIAFEAYQAILAESDRQLQVANDQIDGRFGSVLDEYERPECPACGRPMLLQIFKATEDRPETTRLFCSFAKCDTAFDSDKTLDEWKDLLRKKEITNEAGPGSVGAETGK